MAESAPRLHILGPTEVAQAAEELAESIRRDVDIATELKELAESTVPAATDRMTNGTAPLVPPTAAVAMPVVLMPYDGPQPLRPPESQPPPAHDDGVDGHRGALAPPQHHPATPVTASAGRRGGTRWKTRSGSVDRPGHHGPEQQDGRGLHGHSRPDGSPGLHRPTANSRTTPGTTAAATSSKGQYRGNAAPLLPDITDRPAATTLHDRLLSATADLDNPPL
ncbi:hypothetical protein [Streptomyces purpurogeneiscleroticus]|uniref:hypothetical protein n=1 Tax=Streptomyces purpurogeneiscleroticus TaxID=68259 RepID=UPI00355737C8